MFRRRDINADPGRGARRLLGAAGDLARWPLERLAWLFERLVWFVERRLLWPLQRGGARRLPYVQAGGALALVAVSAAALAAVLALGGGSDPESDRVAVAPAPLAAAPAPQPEPATGGEEPQLRGAPPRFDVGPGVRVANGKGGKGSAGGCADCAAATGADALASSGTGTAGASASAAKPVPAGPVAMKTARRFAKAFVHYEIGEQPDRAKAAFAATATPQLAEALAARPPRQPASSEVPKARVVNLVAGPRAGKAYTVSVSLLRVGLTSELRLELRKIDGTWLVTDVRG